MRPSRSRRSATWSWARVGDLPPDGGRTFFDGVDPALRGDVVIGNLEGTLSTAAPHKCGADSPNCFAFQTPPSYARWLQRPASPSLNLANNHAFDFGPTGLEQTLAALTGTGCSTPDGRDRSPTSTSGRSGSRSRLRVVPVGARASSTSRLRGASCAGRPSGPTSSSSPSTAAPRARTRRTCRRAPSGSSARIAATSVAFSHAVVDAGADLVVGHGPHVLRGMEWYKGRLIAYSLGNFAGYGVFSLAARWGSAGC